MTQGVIDLSRTENLTGIDEMSSNTRSRVGLPVGGTPLYANTPSGVNWLVPIGTPVSLTPGATQTLTVSQIGTGFVTINSGSTANTTTLDTAANIVSYFTQNTAGAQVGDVMSFYLANGSGTAGGTITLQAGSGGSFDTNQTTRILPINTSRVIFLRLTNVNPGTEAYFIFT